MVRWKRAWLLAIAGLIVVVFNFTGISYLPSFPPKDQTSHAELARSISPPLDPSPHIKHPKLKPWPPPSSPLLPSFLPWCPPQPDLPAWSCEGFFGNGFLRTVDLLNSSTASASGSRNSRARNKSENSIGGDADDLGSMLKCYFSDTLRTSICEARNVVMHPERMRMSMGGEPIGTVIGRTDEEELPSFSMGAFELIIPSRERFGIGIWSSSDPSHRIGTSDPAIDSKLINSILPQGQINDHRLRSLFASFRAVDSTSIHCSKVSEPTLLVIRYEYANLFHTATDWYSAYAASRVLDLEAVPNVVFLDGHCESPMDDGWRALFSDIKYAKHFDAPVCFDRVVFTPLGYETALFKGLNSGIPCKGCSAEQLLQKKGIATTPAETARLREFGEFFKYSFGIVGSNPASVLKVLFVRREDYLAHPRHGGKPETRLQNEPEILEEMRKWAEMRSDGRTRVEIIDGTLAHMQMRDQVQAVQDASIIVGVHGAGLTHILFAQPGTVILELLSPLFMRPHYAHISQWMGLEYHSITMQGTFANPAAVLDHMSSILARLRP